MLEPTLILKNENLTLKPLDQSVLTTLSSLASEPAIWDFAPEPYHEPGIFKTNWLEKALEQMRKKERLCFVIFYNGQIAGSTSYYEIDEDHQKLNIGYTWFHPSFWGSKINPLCKLTLLNYAFEDLKLNRVGFSVDSRNQRSCHALKKLGIKHEGLLRNHLVLPNGIIRHSEMFSVIREEWQETKAVIENIVKNSG